MITKWNPHQPVWRGHSCPRAGSRKARVETDVPVSLALSEVEGTNALTRPLQIPLTPRNPRSMFLLPLDLESEEFPGRRYPLT
jgi:hypothetical protein